MSGVNLKLFKNNNSKRQRVLIGDIVEDGAAERKVWA
jgi:hypothetical protein